MGFRLLQAGWAAGSDWTTGESHPRVALLAATFSGGLMGVGGCPWVADLTAIRRHFSAALAVVGGLLPWTWGFGVVSSSQCADSGWSALGDRLAMKEAEDRSATDIPRTDVTGGPRGDGRRRPAGHFGMVSGVDEWGLALSRPSRDAWREGASAGEFLSCNCRA